MCLNISQWYKQLWIPVDVAVLVYFECISNHSHGFLWLRMFVLEFVFPTKRKGKVILYDIIQRHSVLLRHLIDQPGLSIYSRAKSLFIFHIKRYHYLSRKWNPNNKVHGDNMGPTWVLPVPCGPHVGPMNLAIWDNLEVRWMVLSYAIQKHLCHWQVSQLKTSTH